MDAGNVRRLFLAALEVSQSQRGALLDDPAISPAERKAVVELLSFDSGPDGGDTISQSISELRREAVTGRFGAYELGESLGRGGMGAVYKANRADGEVKQVVAIKIIERQWLDPKTIDRFRRERQILSGLAHPNIARLLDTGTREDGRPYLVMEFIDGEPLDEYCRKQELSIRERLRLFLPLCRAVEYAHSKLVIHRDLKPSNILVTAAGEPKLLDFGIAGALDEPGESTTNTLLFTPSHGSPEQARGEPPSTAMDVYGLGSVLYHLLTGAAPHVVEGLAPMEMVRRLCEEEPPPPASINPEIDRDLENIVRKAMHFEPQRRYVAARELADDLERFLAHRPVTATPDTLVYRLARFATRRRRPLAAAVVAMIVIAAVAVSAWNSKRRADEEAEIANAVKDFLQNDLISQAGARSQIERGDKPDPNLKVRTLLDRAALSVPRKFRGLPKVEAAIRVAIGGAYQDLGLEDEARKQYEQALSIRRAVLGRSARETLVTANLLGVALIDQGKRKEAEAVLRDVVASAGRGKESQPAAARARYTLAMLATAAREAGAMQWLEQSIREVRQVEGTDSLNVLDGLNQLAVLYLDAGNADQAERMFRDILDTRMRTQGATHPDTLSSMSELGVFFNRRSRFPEAEELLQRSAEGMAASLGTNHQLTLNTLNNLTSVYVRHGRYGEAAAVRRRILDGQKTLRGPDHPDTLAAAHNLASAYQLGGDYANAARIYEQTLAGFRKLRGPEHPSTFSGTLGLASAYRELGRTADSVRLAGEALSLARRVYGNHVDTASAVNEMARAQRSLGRLSESEKLFREALDMRVKLLGPRNHSTLITKNDLAGLIQETGRYKEAEALFHETLEVRRKLLGEEHPSTLNTMNDLAVLFHKQRKLDEAAQLQQKVLDGRRKVLGAGHPNVLRAIRDLAVVYRDQGRCTESRSLLSSVLESVGARARNGETLRGLSEDGLRQELGRCRVSAAAATR